MPLNYTYNQGKKILSRLSFPSFLSSFFIWASLCPCSYELPAQQRNGVFGVGLISSILLKLCCFLCYNGMWRKVRWWKWWKYHMVWSTNDNVKNAMMRRCWWWWRWRSKKCAMEFGKTDRESDNMTLFPFTASFLLGWWGGGRLVALIGKVCKAAFIFQWIFLDGLW